MFEEKVFCLSFLPFFPHHMYLGGRSNPNISLASVTGASSSSMGSSSFQTSAGAPTISQPGYLPITRPPLFPGNPVRLPFMSSTSVATPHLIPGTNSFQRATAPTILQPGVPTILQPGVPNMSRASVLPPSLIGLPSISGRPVSAPLMSSFQRAAAPLIMSSSPLMYGSLASSPMPSAPVQATNLPHQTTASPPGSSELHLGGRIIEGIITNDSTHGKFSFDIPIDFCIFAHWHLVTFIVPNDLCLQSTCHCRKTDQFSGWFFGCLPEWSMAFTCWAKGSSAAC